VADEIERREVTVHRVPGSGLVKGRGGPRCMSRPIYGGSAVRNVSPAS
jgi:arginine deiminase